MVKTLLILATLMLASSSYVVHDRLYDASVCVAVLRVWQEREFIFRRSTVNIHATTIYIDPTHARHEIEFYGFDDENIENLEKRFGCPPVRYRVIR